MPQIALGLVLAALAIAFWFIARYARRVAIRRSEQGEETVARTAQIRSSFARAFAWVSASLAVVLIIVGLASLFV